MERRVPVARPIKLARALLCWLAGGLAGWLSACYNQSDRNARPELVWPIDVEIAVFCKRRRSAGMS
ncbi:uncharacterized protein SETTUDRAFT_167103 [Exserohilum turcica Et28A]|uniref:Uncharacterized protein n=1 Tax=Exserohilum turcicum (strain 28A) TaxID=671987 RepID=R0IZM2_EXST2|nr:uncharacterized protein SETTUDRAFT_167103 [Exserohilum turcica Et28A]EOA90155.1 hypothetical protein SETTUDRAFT_167103 [Exserohilum turcica Et28A]